jgi:hypothetical protein
MQPVRSANLQPAEFIRRQQHTGEMLDLSSSPSATLPLCPVDKILIR